MKKLKMVLSVLIIITLTVTIATAFATIKTQNNSGKCSSVTIVDEQSKQWIIENFGEYETVEALLDGLTEFACKRFVYTDKTYIQYFDFREFVFEDNFHGLCFDFACFAKNVVYQWSIYKGIDVQVYVCDVRLPNNNGHSYNFICYDEKTYFIDLTSDNTRYIKGSTPLGYDDISEFSFEEYVAIYDEKIMNLH